MNGPLCSLVLVIHMAGHASRHRASDRMMVRIVASDAADDCTSNTAFGLSRRCADERDRDRNSKNGTNEPHGYPPWQ